MDPRALAVEVSKQVAALAAAVGIAACGGGGDSTPPAAPSGSLDATYGIAGKVTFAAAEAMGGADVDGAGNAYVTGASIAKVASSGTRVAGYGGPADPPEFAPVVDEAGNLFTVANGAIVKRNASGQIDTAFGNAGRAQVTPWAEGSAGTLDRVHRESDGPLLAVGLLPGFQTALHRAAAFVQLAKVDPSGSLVADFGVGGRKYTSIGLHLSMPGLASALDSQGNLLVAGRDPDGRYVVHRFDPNGGPPGVFPPAGAWFWASPPCGVSDSGTAIAASTSGAIYLGASCEGVPTVFKLTSQGSLDASFGNAGRATAFLPRAGSVGALLPVADGGLYVAGAVASETCVVLAVTKLDASGVPVTAFGENGTTILSASANAFRKLLKLDSSGLLYVGAGGWRCPVPEAPNPYTLFRLSP